MKRFLIFFMLICSYVLCGAQVTSLTVDNQTPGWLSSKIEYGNQQTIESLTITGYINASDLQFIGTLMQKHNLHQSLDLSETYIIGDSSNDDNEISYDNIFGLNAPANINLLSLPKSIITPTPKSDIIPFRFLSVDTLIYGSKDCQTYNNALWGTSHPYGDQAGTAPKKLILREGVTSISDFACQNGDPKFHRIETVECPTTINAIGKGAFFNCDQLHSINLPDAIETIEFEAFSGTSFLPDTLYLPKSLTLYYTTAFPVKDGQVVIIPESVSKIDNTYKTYSNTFNTWTTWDHIKSTNSYYWIMKCLTPPSVTYKHIECLRNSTIFIPHNSYASYSSKAPFSRAKLIEAKIVESVNVTPKQATIIVGKNTNLNVRVQPLDAEDVSVSWTSSDPSIAIVSEDGLVSANSPGKAAIYAISNNNPDIKDVCEVTVIQPVSGISLNEKEIELIEDEVKKLNVTIIPANASNKDVNWTSSDVSVAMVSPDGTVYAIKPGQATIMATTVDGGFVALCKITVTAKDVIASAIKLSNTSETITTGETIQIVAVLQPENVTNKKLSWTSTNPNIATVDDNGLVKAEREGQTQIVATTTDGSNLSAICEIAVTKQFIDITQIKITPSNAKIALGNSINLQIEITPNNASLTNILWSSTNTAVATVSQDGHVDAITEGDAIIIASTQDGSNLSATCHISVYNDIILISEIILDPEYIEGNENESVTINADILPENATNKRLIWDSSNKEVATVNDGIVKLLKKGITTITAESTDGSNTKSECKIVVSDSAGIESIIEDKNTYVKIFNLSGHTVYEGIYADAKIDCGLYIVLCNGRSFKTIIN